MHWFNLTLLLSCVATSLILVLRHFGGRFNPFLLMTAVATLGAFIFLIFCSVTGLSLSVNHSTLALAFLAGLAVCILDLAFIFMFRFGAPVSLSLPIYRVLSIMISASVGITLFEENLSPMRCLGILAACIAVCLLNWKTKEESHV